jgi:hypothetical protein
MTDRVPGIEPPRDRRVAFFLVASGIVLALYYPTPEEFRWVPMWLGITYFVLAILSALDKRSKERD